MFALKSFASQVLAIGSLVSLATASFDTLPFELILKRQSAANGTNKFNCHSNCGEAILQQSVPGFCNSTIFSLDYANCLQCAGSDNEDIWQFYGPYLTEGADDCGSATVPLTGTQAPVASAIAAANATTTAADGSSTPTGDAAAGGSPSNTAATTTPTGGAAGLQISVCFSVAGVFALLLI